MKYPAKITIPSIDAAAEKLGELAPRASILHLRALMRVVMEQGVTPADLADKLGFDRNNHSVQSVVKRLNDWGFITLEACTNEGDHQQHKKQIWLTEQGAELFGLFGLEE